MFYRFFEKIHTVSGVTADIRPGSGRPIAAFLSVSELDGAAAALGLPLSTVRQCKEEVRHFRNTVEVGEGYSFVTVKRTGGDASGEDCIALYLLRDLFVVVDIRDSDGSTRRGFEAAVQRYPAATVTAGQLVSAFLESLINGDGRLLEELEFDFSQLEESVLREAADDDFIIRLLHHKQYLLLLHSYYQQLIDIGEALTENENRLFAKGDLRYFRRFADKTERLCRTVVTLREQLGQLREAYQSMLDLRLGAIMKTFTVLSAVFLPLSLIVGWYGMNFDGMPELHWRYGYPAVALLCGAVALICIQIFRRHHWM